MPARLPHCGKAHSVCSTTGDVPGAEAMKWLRLWSDCVVRVRTNWCILRSPFLQLARQYAAVLSKNIGQNIIVENRPIAGGAVAAAAIQSAPPDGYTLLAVIGSQFCSVPAMGPVPNDRGLSPT